MLSIASFFKLLKESFRDLLPIVLVIMFFQLAIIQVIPDNWLSTTIGLAIVGVGLAVFLLGLEVGIFPVGEGLAGDFARKGSTAWIIEQDTINRHALAGLTSVDKYLSLIA